MIKCSLENAEVTKCSKVTQYDVLKSAFAEENYRVGGLCIAMI